MATHSGSEPGNNGLSSTIHVSVILKQTPHGYMATTPDVRSITTIEGTIDTALQTIISQLTEYFKRFPLLNPPATDVTIVTVEIPIPAQTVTDPILPDDGRTAMPYDPQEATSTVQTTEAYMRRLATQSLDMVATLALYQLERRFTGITQLLDLRHIPGMNLEEIANVVHEQAYKGRIELFDYLREMLIPRLTALLIERDPSHRAP